MSYDALMRWEWEGGTPASVSERDEAARNEPAENTLTLPQPTKGHQLACRVATASPLPSQGWRGDVDAR
jgi:hypothetical protein